MNAEGLGRTFEDGEVIVRQGEEGDCMYVVQEGQVQVYLEKEGRELPLRVLGKGEFIGEMSIFEREVRSASVRAVGGARLLTVDRVGFLRRIHEDPSLAFRVVQTLSRRVRDLSDEVARLRTGG
jgi:CRP-like cAMP-binding protein